MKGANNFVGLCSSITKLIGFFAQPLILYAQILKRSKTYILEKSGTDHKLEFFVLTEPCKVQ